MRLLALVLAPLLVAPTPVAAPSHVTGTLPSGATYVMDVPASWNGTVLLFSHGYVPQGGANPAQNAPSDVVRSSLLERGYALIGSSYATTGWVFEQALPDQLSTLDEFTARFGRARHTYAWGMSYGGMVTAGLAERYGARFDGTLAMCGLLMGGVANWNSTLDLTFALSTLLAPRPMQLVGIGPQSALSSVQLVRFPDQAAAVTSQGQLQAAIEQAQATPTGQARIALAAALHNIPGWTWSDQPEPAPTDYVAQELNQYRLIGLSVLAGTSWRQEAESRAGGNMAWNVGVDYARMLARSSMRTQVEALYARAGLSLRDDLAALAGAPRITADLRAVAYMARNIAFTGRLVRPMLTLHTTGDSLVPVQAEQAYATTVRDAGRSPLLRQTYVHRGGHCAFTLGETVASVLTLVHHGDTGVAALNRLATSIDPATTPAYVDFRPTPYPRPFDL
jgi:dienelactone hydrolase